MRNWERRAECGKLRAEFGEWRAELKALGCLPCKGGGPQSGGEVLIKSVESGEWRVELKALVCLPCKGRGTAERWRGFD